MILLLSIYLSIYLCSVGYVLIAIIPRSTLAVNGSTCLVWLGLV